MAAPKSFGTQPLRRHTATSLGSANPNDHHACVTTTEAELAPLVLRGDFQVCVLGPLELRYEGRLVEVTGVARNLLALLARTPGQVVPLASIASGLWGELIPEAAEKAVAAYVARLHKALDLGADGVDPATVVVGNDSGYLLAIDPSHVDVTDFERLVVEGQRALTVGQPALAVTRLDTALRMWRGNAYSDLGGQPFARTEAARLAHLRLCAIESRVDALLALAAPSAPPELADELWTLVGNHPNRERLWTQLVTVLHRLGRRADALAAFQQARTRLAEDFGVEPGAELRAAERGVLDGDPALDGRPLTPAVLPEALSSRVTECVGRDEELAWLDSALDTAAVRRGQARLIIGTAGIGKTRLVVELAHRAAQRGVTVRYGQRAGCMEALVAAPDRLTLVILDDLDEAGREEQSRVISFIRATTSRAALTVVTATDVVRVGELGALPKLVLTPLGDRAVADIVRHYAPGTTEATAVTAMANARGVPVRLHRTASEWAFARAGRRIDRAVADAAEPQRWLAAVREEVVAGVMDLEHVRTKARVLRRNARDVAACPYPGLVRFDRGDADVFHGRESLVAELIARLVAMPLLAVVGPSGSGKSSVVRAGLLPALAAGVLPESGLRPQVIVTPSTAGDLSDHLSPSREAAPVLVVDQFEEVFTALDSARRATFVAMLVSAARAGRATVVLTLRSDHYARCSDFPALSHLVTANTVLVPPLTPEEVRRAVQRPAALAGLSIEDGLVDLIVAEARTVADGRPGMISLPHLAALLRRMWEHRSGRTLTVASYRDSGGIAGAVEAAAEAAFAGLASDTERDAARRMLIRLADINPEPGPVAAPVDRAGLESSGGPNAAAVLDALVAKRVVAVSEVGVQVAHQTVVTHWPRLHAWLEDESVGRQLRARLTPAASSWAASGGGRQSLYQGAHLAATQAWAAEHPSEVSGVERAFLAASQDATRIVDVRRGASVRRLRQLLAVSCLVLAVAVAGAVVTLTRQHRAGVASVGTDAARLTALSLAEPDPRQAVLLGLAAIALEDSPTARGAVLNALLRTPDLVAVNTVEGRATAIALSPDAGTVAVAAEAGPILLWDATTLRETGRLDLPGHQPVRDLEFTPDGRRLVSWGGPTAWADSRSQPPAIVVWDLAAKAPISTPFGEAHIEAGGGLLADGVTLVVNQRDADGTVAPVAWNIDSRTPSTAYALPTADASRVVVTPDGRHVLALTPTGALVIDASTGASRPIEDVTGPAELSPSGDTLIAADGVAVAVWEAGMGRRRSTARGLASPVVGLAFAADGKAFAAGGADGSVLVWDAATARVSRQWRLPSGPARVLRFAADGRTLLAGGGDGTVYALDLTGRRGLAGRLGAPVSAEFAFVSAGTAAGQFIYRDAEGVHVHDSVAGRDVGRTVEVGPAVRLAAAGEYLAGVLPAGGGQVWDLRTGTKVADLPIAGGGAGWSVAIDAAGQRVAIGERSSAGSGVVKVFSLRTGAPTGPTFSVPRLGAGLAFSPDGRLLAAGIAGEDDTTTTGHVRVWSVADSAEAALLAVPSAGAEAIAFSPDGRWLAAGPVLFDAAAWTPVVQLPSGQTGDAGGLAALAFGPDPSGALALLLASTDGVLLRADPDPATWLGQACAYIGRDLTLTQWQTYLPDRPYRQVCPA